MENSHYPRSGFMAMNTKGILQPGTASSNTLGIMERQKASMPENCLWIYRNQVEMFLEFDQRSQN